MSDEKLYRAQRIHTMCPDTPEATHVAIRGERIAAVGDASLAQRYGRADERFADAVLTPGFVEGHAHAMEGMIWKLPYIGYYDRVHPDGHTVPGCDSVGTLVDRLRTLAAELAEEETLFAWGYDSIYFADKPMRGDLDRVSQHRPVVLFHSNLHLITVNSLALQRAGIHRDNVIPGVYVDADGEPNGELAEFAAMFPVFRAVGNPVFGAMDDADGLHRFARACHRAGITTVADLYNNLEDTVVDIYDDATRAPQFPVRVAVALAAMEMAPPQVIERAARVAQRSHDKLYLGTIKIITDGSIQGYSARVCEPYINGVENGVWFEAPPKIRRMLEEFHGAGLQLHIHVNGDEAAEWVLQCFEEIIPRQGAGPRHVLQHAQMMDRDQLRRAATLGLGVNLFANHTYYWGDQHRDATVGATRAARMNAARSALDLGIEVALHCDAPVTPLGPLFTAWCAVNRRTASGQVLGDAERISAAEALRALTWGGAVSLGLQDRIGSIAVGKFADFTVLDRDPLAVPPMELRDIAVRGTLLGGRWQPTTPP